MREVQAGQQVALPHDGQVADRHGEDRVLRRQRARFGHYGLLLPPGLPYLEDACVLQFATVRKVQNSETFVTRVWWKAKKCIIRNARAMRKAKFSEMGTFANQGGN